LRPGSQHRLDVAETPQDLIEFSEGIHPGTCRRWTALLPASMLPPVWSSTTLFPATSATVLVIALLLFVLSRGRIFGDERQNGHPRSHGGVEHRGSPVGGPRGAGGTEGHERNRRARDGHQPG
jgi:hypothetical protein